MYRTIATSVSIVALLTPFNVSAESAAGANSALSSGEAGARAGTLIYNTINREKPLPQASGSVVEDTVKNLGKGQGPKEAWNNAARDNAGLGKVSGGGSLGPGIGASPGTVSTAPTPPRGGKKVDEFRERAQMAK